MFIPEEGPEVLSVSQYVACCIERIGDKQLSYYVLLFDTPAWKGVTLRLGRASYPVANLQQAMFVHHCSSNNATSVHSSCMSYFLSQHTAVRACGFCYACRTMCEAQNLCVSTPCICVVSSCWVESHSGIYWLHLDLHYPRAQHAVKYVAVRRLHRVWHVDNIFFAFIHIILLRWWHVFFKLGLVLSLFCNRLQAPEDSTALFYCLDQPNVSQHGRCFSGKHRSIQQTS